MGLGSAELWSSDVHFFRQAAITEDERVAALSSAASRELALLETICGCYKLIVNRHLPTVQRWLKDLVKVRQCRNSSM